ncbi:MAG: SLBB domain-containing protein, partial [Candidatus Marinimicrobia bacterium]|nr:SLBB domain-containing protein [Candidatus Neomarinimicrobiota bacterium]
MKKSILLLLMATVLLLGQSTEELKKAAKKAGITTEAQARELAKQRGMTDAQIDAEMKERGLTPGEEAAAEKPQVEPVEAPPSEAVVETTTPEDEAVGEEISPVDEEILPLAGEEEIPTVAEDEIPTIEEEELTVQGEEELEDIEEVSIESQLQPGRKGLPYFGYDVFEGDPELFQASTLGAIDPHYSIGPGDEIIIMLWGETQFRQVFTVGREGFIFVPDVGQVFVNGLTLENLEKKLFRVLSQSYASLNPSQGNASTFLDVSLGNLRPLRIMALGEVGQPGAYSVNPSTTLFTSLYYFKGLTTLGSLRDIRLVRNGKKMASIDLYDYLLTGKPANDVRLQLDDVIFIPPRGKTVSIQGEIKREAIYELKKGETLEELITIAGGLKTTAYLDRAQVDRIVPFEERAEVGMDRILMDVDLNDILYSDSEFALKDGDQVQLFSVLDIRQNVVVITGASVGRPGIYDLGDSLRLSELIMQADSLLGDAYVDRADIIRFREDLREELLKVNLGKAMEGDREHDIFLQPMDRVQIYSLTEMIPGHRVALSGHVKRPGRYPLLEEMTLYDLIFKGGGFIDEEFRELTYLQRAELVRVKEDSVTKEIIPFNLADVLEKKGLAETLLRSEDAVRIYSLAEIEGAPEKFVSIAGHVKRAGRYELFEENMTLYDLIFKAGGFDDEEHLKLTYLQRAELVRVNEDTVTKEIIPFNLADVLEKKGLAETLLRSEDAVRIYSLAEIEGAPEKFISIAGHVKRPGEYELFEENMMLSDLLFQAGGFDDPIYRSMTFLGRADLLRLDEGQITRTIIPLNLGEVLDNPESQQNLALRPDDIVRVYPKTLFNEVKQVTIEGSVKSPGQFDLKTGMTLKDLILEAGGVDINLFRYKVDIARIDPENNSFERFAEVITLTMDEKFTLSDVAYKNNINPGEVKKIKRTGFLLEPYDVVSIRPDPYFSLQRKVTITGEVMYPGSYTILSPDEKITDIIKRAGGLRPEAYTTASRFTRQGQTVQMSFDRIIRNPRSGHNFSVQGGDEIVIAPRPNLVYVNGEVNNPGLRKFVPGKRLRYYIDATGGYTPDADKWNVFVQLPSGDSFKITPLTLVSPKILDGSIIT